VLDTPRAPSAREILAAPSLRNVLIACILAAIAAGAAATYVLRAAPVYQSAETLLIDQPRAINAPGGEGVVTKLNVLRTKYAALVRTELVVAPVSEATGVGAGEVASSLGAVVPPQALLFQVTARSDDPATAEQLAAAAAAELREYLDGEQAIAGIPEADRIVLTTATAARPGAKVEPTVQRAITVAAAAGVLALGAAYVAIQLVTAARPPRPR
jgi:capsular polysaccharide biosynthesis protein